jgi:hypothetical protein
MASLQKPIFQQGAPLDIGELNKLYDNTVTAYSQSAILVNATQNAQSQSFVSVGYPNTDTVTLDANGSGSKTVSFGNTFQSSPTVVASLGSNPSNLTYTVGVTVTGSNGATIYVYGGKSAAGKTVTVNYIAMINKQVDLT